MSVDHSQLEVAEQVPKHLQYSTQISQDQPAYTTGDHHGNPESTKTICGLRPTAFFLLLALICVIVAAAVGGGVGGSLAVKHAKNSNAEAGSTITITKTETQIQTATSSSPSGSASSTASILSVPTTGTLPIPCPLPSPSNVVITLGSTSSTFSITCGADFTGIPGSDILAIIVYSLHDCAQACASYNRDLGSIGCKAATFNSDLTDAVPANFGTCWLKNNTGGMTTSSKNFYAGLVLSGT